MAMTQSLRPRVCCYGKEGYPLRGRSREGAGEQRPVSAPEELRGVGKRGRYLKLVSGRVSGEREKVFGGGGGNYVMSAQSIRSWESVTQSEGFAFWGIYARNNRDFFSLYLVNLTRSSEDLVLRLFSFSVLNAVVPLRHHPARSPNKKDEIEERETTGENNKINLLLQQILKTNGSKKIF